MVVDKTLQLVCKLLPMLVLASLLNACGENEADDLTQFMASADGNMTKDIEPLPKVLPYVPAPYNADGSLTDPFRPRKAARSSSALQPDHSRTKEPLENFPLESLKYVGFLNKNNVSQALIKAPDNTLQQVKAGNYLGTNFGLVTQITDETIQIKEIVQDDLAGDWVARNASINLQENNDEKNSNQKHSN